MLLLNLSLPRELILGNRGKNHKGVHCFLPQQFWKDLNYMLNTGIKDAPNFIRTSISSMKKYYLNIIHELWRIKLCDSSPVFIFSMYYHQAIVLIESKIHKPFAPKLKKKLPHNVCSIFFENKGIKSINIARILRDPNIVKFIPSSSVKLPLLMFTYRVIRPIFTKFFNFNKIVNNQDLGLFLINPDSLPCKCNNSPFVDRHHKHIKTGDLRIIITNVLRKGSKSIIKGSKYRGVKPIAYKSKKKPSVVY